MSTFPSLALGRWTVIPLGSLDYRRNAFLSVVLKFVIRNVGLFQHQEFEIVSLDFIFTNALFFEEINRLLFQLLKIAFLFPVVGFLSSNGLLSSFSIIHLSYLLSVNVEEVSSQVNQREEKWRRNPMSGEPAVAELKVSWH